VHPTFQKKPDSSYHGRDWKWNIFAVNQNQTNSSREHAFSTAQITPLYI